MDPAPAEKHTVRVTIFNQTYTVLADNEAEVQRAANRVDELMITIARAGNIDTTRVAVLAALHLADKLCTLERDVDAIQSRIDSKTREFSLLLDQVIE